MKVRKDVCNDIDQFILSEGPKFESAFYDYAGRLVKQANKGVQWLTKLKGDESVSRLKTGLIGSKILMIY